MTGGLTHLNEKGEAHMVDVGGKDSTRRRAVARIAGIMAAKKTADLIPLCHPIPLTKVEVEIVGEGVAIAITATAETTGQTGVEMEALTAASVTALTLYDMAKAIDRGMTITNVQLVEKTGGKSGDYQREP